MKSMKVSIIVPTYCRPALLRCALDSAAQLDFDPQQYEVCVVNDGGAGVDRHRVRDWWKGKAPLQYARIRHAGLSAAVNRGLSLARGLYCTVLPDDDLVLPNKLRVLAGYLDAHPQADVVYSLPQYVDAKGSPLDTPAQLRKFLRAHGQLTWAHIQSGHGLHVHGASTMYRTSVCRDVGGWDTKLETGEEYEFHLRLLKKGHDFWGLEAVTTGYRVHPGSKSNQYRKDRSKMRRYIADKLGKK